MQKKKTKHNSTYSFIKSLKNRLSFAYKKKGFLSKEKDKVEVLELEEIEVLEEIPTEKVLRTKNDVVEFLDVEEPKLRRKTIRLKPMVRKRIQFASYALSAACLVLFLFSFLLSNHTTIISLKRLLPHIGIYTEAIKKVEIAPNDYDNPGSWHIDKTAKWTGKGKAQVKVELSSILIKSNARPRDVIIVLDVSESMEGDKIDQAKSDLKELINYVLSDNTNNRVAVITFNSFAEIRTGFTNNREELEEALNVSLLNGCTNYNKALQKIDEVMNGYSSQEEKDAIVLFITDGHPNEEVRNNEGTYQLLKDKYPYINMNGIQYEVNETIIGEIKNISDRQWNAKTKTLKSVLIEATMHPIRFSEMKLTDTISDYFRIESISDTKASKGEVSLEEDNNTQKVIWDLGEEKYSSGTKATLTMNLVLKDEYLDDDDFFPTSKNEKILSQLSGETEKTTNSANTPVLKSAYQVLYDANAPLGCSASDNTIETYNVFKIVSKKTSELSCNGYLFQGWKIDGTDENDITMINEYSFLMPEHDVHIRGTWTKQEIEKTMDGTVYERTTLYKVLENEAINGTLAKEYTGEHQDSFTTPATKKIYYWYAATDENASEIIEKDNVIFAEHCWQMIRTTDTGGVRLLYNGEVENGKCLSTRGTHVGEVDITNMGMSVNYYYGTDYTYDEVNNKFQLSGEVTTGTINVGQFTCRSTNPEATCSTLYIPRTASSSGYYSVVIKNTATYEEIGSEVFSQEHKLLADAGYMTNKSYGVRISTRNQSKTMFSTKTMTIDYWYGNDIAWNEDTSQYELVDPFQITDSTEMSTLKNKYTFYSTETTGETVNYIVHTSESTSYYVTLAEGNLLSYYNDTCYYGSGYADNGDGTFSITSPTSFNIFDWASNYSSVKNKYLCLSSNCTEAYYVLSSDANSFSYLSSNNTFKIANSFTYEDGSYHLSDDGEIFRDISIKDTNKSKLYNKHYTCWNTTGECTSISYIYYLNENSFYYINVSGGKSIEDAINDLLYAEDVNTKDAYGKEVVDRWYKKNISETLYDYYVEDEIYCNDRTISDYGGWNPNGGKLDKYLRFNGYVSSNKSLKCIKETDMFSVSNPKAKLTYPIGMITVQELRLINKTIYRDSMFWTMTPAYSEYGQNSRTTYAYRMKSSGSITASLSGYTITSFRPVISLKPDITFESGDGSTDAPYVVDMESLD